MTNGSAGSSATGTCATRTERSNRKKHAGVFVNRFSSSPRGNAGLDLQRTGARVEGERADEITRPVPTDFAGETKWKRSDPAGTAGPDPDAPRCS